MAKVPVDLDFGGSARAGQTVTVKQHDTQAPVTVYGRDGTTPLSPVVVAKNGHVYFMVDPGTYDVAGPDLMRVITVVAPTAATRSSGLVLDTAPGPDVVNGVSSHMLIRPSDAYPAANAITVKRPSHSAGGWGNTSDPYGTGQVFELLSDTTADTSTPTDPANPVLFRIDAFGGLGLTHGVHVATGLRRQGDDTPPTQSIWIDPSIDTIGIIIDNPTTTEVAGTPTQDFLLIRDVRGTAYSLVRVLADGTVQSNKALIASSRLAGDIALLVQPAAGATAGADGFRFTDASGKRRIAIENTVGLLGGVADDGSTKSFTLAALSAGNAGYRAIFAAVNTGVHGVAITSPAGFTADHLQVVPSAGMKFRINKAGYPMGRLNAAPVLDDMVDGEWALWLDTAGNAFKVSARVGGVLKTGTVAVA